MGTVGLNATRCAFNNIPSTQTSMVKPLPSSPSSNKQTGTLHSHKWLVVTELIQISGHNKEAEETNERTDRGDINYWWQTCCAPSDPLGGIAPRKI